MGNSFEIASFPYMNCTKAKYKSNDMNLGLTNEMLISVKKTPVNVSLSAFNASVVARQSHMCMCDSSFNESSPHFKGITPAISDTRTLF